MSYYCCSGSDSAMGRLGSDFSRWDRSRSMGLSPQDLADTRGIWHKDCHYQVLKASIYVYITTQDNAWKLEHHTTIVYQRLPVHIIRRETEKAGMANLAPYEGKARVIDNDRLV